MKTDGFFPLELLSPTKPLATLNASYVSLPGIWGYLGILPNHTDIVCELRSGLVLIETHEQKLHYFISGGYVEIYGNKAKILVDTIEAMKDIDLGRAKEAEKRALDRLKQSTSLDLNIPRALASLERARARQKLALMGQGLSDNK